MAVTESESYCYSHKQMLEGEEQGSQALRQVAALILRARKKILAMNSTHNPAREDFYQVEQLTKTCLTFLLFLFSSLTHLF